MNWLLTLIHLVTKMEKVLGYSTQNNLSSSFQEKIKEKNKPTMEQKNVMLLNAVQDSQWLPIKTILNLTIITFLYLNLMTNYIHDNFFNAKGHTLQMNSSFHV